MVARLLVVDDHASFRSIAVRLSVADGVTIVGEPEVACAHDGPGRTVTVRTVEGHLYRAGLKLGVSERTALADLFGVG